MEFGLATRLDTRYFTRRESQLVKVLLEDLGSIFSVERIAGDIYNGETWPNDMRNQVSSLIQKLRPKLLPIGYNILNRSGKGYYLRKVK